MKICGINTLESLKAVLSTEANAVGFVTGVPESPRNISLKKALKLRRKVPKKVKSVLVMVPSSLQEVNHAVKNIQPNLIQLHGISFDTSMIDIPVIRAVNNKTRLKRAMKTANNCEYLLLDSYHKKLHGGTGITQDLLFAKKFIKKLYPSPVILAGGLNPSNVSEAIQLTNAYGVDVSSGVESIPGVKDTCKIRDFVKEAKKMEKIDK